MKQKIPTKKTLKSQLVNRIQMEGRTYGMNTVFTTFLELAALASSVLFDPTSRSERYQQLEELKKKQNPNLINACADMIELLGQVVEEYMDAPCDILGSIYHDLKLNNAWNGQFFTSDEICRLMARLTFGKGNQDEFRTANEPACGSGAMILGAAAVMKENGDNLQNILWIAHDNDIRCVWMAYIQLTLFKIPAVIIHGNSLTQEEWSRWYTPYIPCGTETTSVYADMPPVVVAASV